jgi:hypothetical protein
MKNKKSRLLLVLPVLSSTCFVWLMLYGKSCHIKKREFLLFLYFYWRSFWIKIFVFRERLLSLKFYECKIGDFLLDFRGFRGFFDCTGDLKILWKVTLKQKFTNFIWPTEVIKTENPSKNFPEKLHTKSNNRAIKSDFMQQYITYQK